MKQKQLTKAQFSFKRIAVSVIVALAAGLLVDMTTGVLKRVVEADLPEALEATIVYSAASASIAVLFFSTRWAMGMTLQQTLLPKDNFLARVSFVFVVVMISLSTGIATFSLSNLFDSVDLGFPSWLLPIPLILFSLYFFVAPAILRMGKLLQQDLPDLGESLVTPAAPLEELHRPKAILLAMSRPYDPRDEKYTYTQDLLRKIEVIGQSADASLKQVNADVSEEERNHPWFHTVSQLRALVGDRKSGGSPPKIHVLVSMPSDQLVGGNHAAIDDDMWKQFNRLLNLLLSIRYPLLSSPPESEVVQLISHVQFDIEDYTDIHQKVRSAITRWRDEGLTADQICINITGATKMYSVAAAMAAVNTHVYVAYMKDRIAPELWGKCNSRDAETDCLELMYRKLSAYDPEALLLRGDGS